MKTYQHTLHGTELETGKEYFISGSDLKSYDTYFNQIIKKLKNTNIYKSYRIESLSEGEALTDVVSHPIYKVKLN